MEGGRGAVERQMVVDKCCGTGAGGVGVFLGVVEALKVGKCKLMYMLYFF